MAHNVTANKYTDTRQGCELHSTVILSQVDMSLLNKLGIRVTCEPVYQTNRLYHK